MRNVRRRLHALERLFPFQTPPSPLEQIRSLALRRLSQPELDLLVSIRRQQSAGAPPIELSQGEVAAYAGWAAALDVEARRIGFRSYADAEQSMGRRR